MSYRDTILNDGPIIYWRFNEFSGDYTFDEIQGLPLNYTFLNGTSVINPQQNGLINDPNFSIELDNAYVRTVVPYNYALPGSFEIWFRTTTVVSDNATLLTNYQSDDDWSLRLRTISLGGQIVLEVNTTQGKISLPAQGINFNDGEIYYVAITYDGSTLIIFVNGVARGLVSNITIIDSTSDFASIGNEYFGDISTQYNGFIDEAAFYNQVLTLSDIQKHYNDGINPPVIESFGGRFASIINVRSLTVNSKL